MTSFLVAAAMVAFGSAAEPVARSRQEAAQRPPHQVMAIYFHRTVRCPTCKRIGGLVEEAVVKRFAKHIEAKTVVYKQIDFQDKKNAELAKAYKIEGPALVLANVFDGKVVRWTAMPQVWSLVGKPAELQAYVQDGVVHYLKQCKEEAETEE